MLVARLKGCLRAGHSLGPWSCRRPTWSLPTSRIEHGTSHPSTFAALSRWCSFEREALPASTALIGQSFELLQLAVRRLAAEQKQWEIAQQELELAVQSLVRATESGNQDRTNQAATKVNQAKLEVNEAAGKVYEAERRVHVAKAEYKKSEKEGMHDQNISKVRRALAEGLKYHTPHPLLNTCGHDWDYVGESTMKAQLKPHLEMLIKHKGVPDKQLHPLILVLAGPGQGKSRYLSRLLEMVQAVQPANTKCSKWFEFLLTLENGTMPNDDETPCELIAARMLWQLVGNKRQTGWGGLPRDFTFIQLRTLVREARVSPDDIFGAVAKGEDTPISQIGVVLAIDGLQRLAGGEALGSDAAVPAQTHSRFYQTIRELCTYVNRIEGPLVVGAVAATTYRQASAALGDSPQARYFVDLPLEELALNPPCRARVPVFKAADNKFLQLLIDDLGGHGRALEALEECLEFGDRPEILLAAVRTKLNEKYPNAVPLQVGTVLRWALSGRWLPLEGLDGVDPLSLTLVKLEFNDDRTMCRVTVPYIWIYLGLSRKGASADLQGWALNDYMDMLRGHDDGGHQWQWFNVQFRALVSKVHPDDAKVRLADLHQGALMNPENLGGLVVVNKHLKPIKCKYRYATHFAGFGQRKPFQNSVVPEWPQGNHERNVLTVTDKTVDMAQGRNIMMNAKGAPAADGSVLLELVGGELLAENQQYKQDTARVDTQAVQAERAKSCSPDDVLVILSSGEASASADDLPNRTVFVGKDQRKAYYGPFAGRAWFVAARSWRTIS